MKHTLKVTLILLLIFFLTQAVGLITISKYVDIEKTSETGKTHINSDKYLISPPEMDEQYSWLYITVAIAIGTSIALLIVYFDLMILWKIWFFLSIYLTLILGFFPYVEFFTARFAVIATLSIALIFTILKLFLPNKIIYNFTEIFIYSGIAALLVPILNLFSIVILLTLISFYDYWAVFKTKHMVKLAKFQSKSKLFAGLQVSYDQKKISKKISKKVKTEPKTAILGGGDVAFPLLFAGVVLKVTGSFFQASLISIFAGLALLAMFLYAGKDKYYPAMPLLTLGSLVGYVITLFI